jgi:hypothetical protein
VDKPERRKDKMKTDNLILAAAVAGVLFFSPSLAVGHEEVPPGISSKEEILGEGLHKGWEKGKHKGWDKEKLKKLKEEDPEKFKRDTYTASSED